MKSTIATRGAGRPSKYNPELQAKADDYVLFGFEDQGDVVPSVAGLCCYLGIVRSTAHEWRDKYPRFSVTLEAISVKQENIALNGALGGQLNATIAKLVLANHGYSDKQAVDHTTNGESINAATPAQAAIERFKKSNEPEQ